MSDKFLQLSQNIIIYSFCLLFFLVPLMFCPFNYELFEYNKMMLTYAFTVIIAGAWVMKMIVNRKVAINKTPLDIPLGLFLLSQIISTVFSIDRHVSIWGYYSRFNGGLLSTLSYVLLYYAFVTNFPKEKINKLFMAIISSGILVSLYAILEHFGIDKNIWVQDVQNRVFSTLGQPNWLAAYLAILILISTGLFLPRLHLAKGVTLLVIFYTALLFTKSRSGILGFWTANIILWTMLFYKYRQSIIKPFLFLNSCFLILTFIFGLPFAQINRFTLPELIKSNQSASILDQLPAKPIGSSVIEIGITESSTIRRIVWKGAIDILKHYPLFGSGVETFAFSYYKFRPVEHNMTSEWDFLYNKAHNEYLNYAATTGFFGIGTYLLIIGAFIWWNIVRSIKYQVLSIKYEKQKNLDIHNTYYLILNTALFSAWLSILVTNFFGFSVVIIQLFFYLIPAICFVLNNNYQPANQTASFQQSNIIKQPVQNHQKILTFLSLILTSYFLIQIVRLWYADTLFAAGYHASRNQEFSTAYDSLKKAIDINSNEPLYFDELSYPAAQLSAVLSVANESTASAQQLMDAAILSSNIATTISPNNVNFFKTRTRVFYALSQTDEKYLKDAYESLKKAKDLSPTDPKVRYNLAVLTERLGNRQEAISELNETIRLKIDFRDAYIALAYFYQEEKQPDKAKEALNYILSKIATDDAEAKKLLEELK